MNKTLIVAFFTAFFVIGYLSVFKRHTVTSTQSVDFIVNRPYREVVLLLAQQDSLEQIASASEGIVIHQEWQKIDLQLMGFQKRLIKPIWTATGRAWFTVVLHDPDLGKLNLEFSQHIYANPEALLIQAELIKPDGHLIKHSTFIFVKKINEEQTKFSVKGDLGITRRYPDNWQDHVQQLVTQSNNRNVEKTAAQLKKIAERQGLFIPIK